MNIFLVLMLLATQAFALPGKLQNEDFKTPAQLSAAGAPLSKLLNDTKVYVTANGINQQLSTAITAGIIGGGSGENILKNGDFEAGGVTGWSTFQTTLSNLVPTTAPAACSACSITIGTNTSTPINKTTSLQLTAASAITAGHGFISAAFTVAPKYQGQVMTIRGSYQTLTGVPVLSGTSTNTYAIYAYDVTNAQWIQPAGTYGIVSSTGPIQPAAFQIPTNTTSLQLAYVAVNALATPTTALFDDLSVGPQSTVVTPTQTEWQPYTPVFSAGFGTVTASSFVWRMVGPDLVVQGSMTIGTVAGGAGSISLPSGKSLAPTLLGNSSNTVAASGDIVGRYAANTGQSLGDIITAPGTSVTVVYLANNLNNAPSNIPAPTVATNIFANNSRVTVYFKVPIFGTSTGVQQSSDYDGRATTFAGAQSANQSVTANTTNFSAAASVDRAGAWTGSTFLVQVAGDYQIGANAFLGAAGNIQAFVNGVANPVIGSTTPAGSTSAMVGILPNLKVNDVISIRSQVTTTVSNFAVGISRIGGPQPVQMQPAVAARYTNIAGTGIGSGVNTLIPFATKDYDTANMCVATGCTIPVSGRYQINGRIIYASKASSNGSAKILYIYRNGVQMTPLGVTYSAGNTSPFAITGGDIYFFNQGDVISFYGFTVEGGTTTLDTGAGSNYISIARVAN